MMAYTGIYNPWKLFDGMYTSDGYAKIYSPDEIHFHPDCLSFRNESRAICTDSEFTNYILTEKRTFMKWKFNQVFKPVKETGNQFYEFILSSINGDKNDEESSKPIIPPFVQLHKEHQEKLDRINTSNKNR